MTYDERNNGVIALLDPATQIKTRHLIDRCELVGLDFLIVSGFRFKNQQDALWEIGRIRPGNIVTYVRGGDSKHNYGVAIDFVPVVHRIAMGHLDDAKSSNVRAVLEWAATSEFRKIAAIAVDIGFEYLFPEWDKGHLEYTQGLSLSDLKDGKRPDERKAIREWKKDLTDQLEIAVRAYESPVVTARRKQSLLNFIKMLERKIVRIK
ncbi:Peptidoglycan L-alanyl-D-glutamate endopeptidase CwlK precursor [Symmachiella dynata]|uniref:M15 family metallopeptidase n=1 Tax=Symmachiella dynata TaxID=2527995 RepID=UPI00118A6181|nr:M15 family metallopeptidase [Symmachiella dynata]QDT46156.1 Peptidoglycan L-alanyl-D-glutamate endopeptidase CwlK precursor [Symmachiella dynata]